MFYIGHLEAFDHNLFDQRLFDLPSANPEYDRLFAFGIDPVDGGLPTDQPHEWPSLEAVRAYTKRIRDDIDAGLDPAELAKNAASTAETDPATLLEVAIEHRLMHAETLAYMINHSSIARCVRGTTPVPAPAFSSELVRIPAGSATLGVDADLRTFTWDNEHDAHTVDVPGFAISRCMVSNGDYLRFVEAGGYDARECWTDADWAWREANAVAHPAFWIPQNGRWYWRSMTELIPLPLEWPVYVSHAEASA